MAYGSRGGGDIIPPNTTIVFEIELLDVNQDGKPFKKGDRNKRGLRQDDKDDDEREAWERAR